MHGPVGASQGLVLRSQSLPLLVLAQADVGGPGRRHRAVASGLGQLPWAPAGLHVEPWPESSLLLVSAGATEAGTTIALSSVVLYPARPGAEACAFVYVEERSARSWLSARARPFQIVLCPRLPADTRFVEVSPGARRPVVRALSPISKS